MMKNHGDWVPYMPEHPPAFLPPNTLYCKRESDGMDWYDFLRGRTLSQTTVKMMVRGGIVQVATTDASRLFPAGCTLIEIDGASATDPQRTYAGCSYDPISKSLAPIGRTMAADLTT